MTAWLNAVRFTVKFALIQWLSVISLHPPKLQLRQSPFPLLFELILKEREEEQIDKRNLTLEGPCIIFAIYIHSNEIHNVVALIKFLLILRCQLYMFRTVTVHPQELLCRYCMCRLWYVVRNALSDTSERIG